MKRAMLIPLMMLSACAPFALPAEELEPLLRNNGAIFESFDREQDEFKPIMKEFSWLDAKKTSARAGIDSGLTLFGEPVCEVVIHYRDDGLAVERIDISIYNRGDAPRILERETFEEKIADVEKALNDRLDVKSHSKRESFSAQDPSGRIRNNYGEIRQTVWVKKPLVYILRTSRKGPKRASRGEFIQLEIEAFNPKNDPRKLPILAKGRDKVGDKIRTTPKDNVVKDEDGTIWIDNIPMVDQGFKGYCVVAVGERIARYFGNDNINQHILAEAAGTSSSSGSTYEEMFDALKRLRTKIGANPREVYRRFKDQTSIDKMIKKYNAVAKKMGEKRIDPESDYGMEFNSEVYRALWAKDLGRRNGFFSAVKKNVDAGQPLVWLVILGIVPEENSSQSAGGHMRLINGYNEKAQEIVYTDTWGAGHEKKRMSYDDAWAITSGLVAMIPR